MTTLLTDTRGAQLDGPPTSLRGATQARPRLRTTIIAGLLLLSAYSVICALHDPRGSLGTDTGGKLATVRVMESNGSFDPDLGYWAEAADPAGKLHPLYYTWHLGDGWVNVTTLPMVVAARPLAEIGGLRAVMLLPMLGGILCAFAASALGARLDVRARWPVFWAVGLATPVVVYATDFWEHSLGLGLLLVACVAAYDVALRRKGWRTALLAGLCFGAAATMRTESLVYLAVSLLVVGATQRISKQRWREVFVAACALGGGVVAVVAANQLLERTLIGSGQRAARAAGTASVAGSTVVIRAKEAAIQTLGLNALSFGRDVLVGAVIVACVALGTVALSKPERVFRLAGAIAFAIAMIVYAMRMQRGIGFVPGLLIASPFAVAGLMFSWQGRDRRFVLALALLPIPLVWASQYSGGALPQWGARYELVSGALLAVLGVVALVHTTRRLAFVSVLALAIAISAFGVTFAAVRSHDVADAMEVVVATHNPIVSREQHLLREGGAFYTPNRRWLTAENGAEFGDAVDIVAGTSAPAMTVLQFHGRPVERELGGFALDRKQIVEFVPGVAVDVLTYRRS